jgi:thioredoxin-like negative regulator of GroEL
MGRRGLFGFGRWKPDSTRDPPPKSAWPGSVVDLDDRTFHEFIDKYPVSMIDFYSPTCKPCNAISPRVRVFSKRYRYRVAFGKVNVKANREIAEEYNILSVPHLFIFSYGEKVRSLMGKNLLAEMNDALDDVVMRFEKK